MIYLATIHYTDHKGMTRSVDCCARKDCDDQRAEGKVRMHVKAERGNKITIKDIEFHEKITG